MMMRTNLLRTPARAVRDHFDSGGRNGEDDLVECLVYRADGAHGHKLDAAIGKVVQPSNSRTEGDVAKANEVSQRSR